MRLSEAIRLGSMLKPQIHGGLLTDDGSCALGAAMDASGCFQSYGALERLFPVLLRLELSPRFCAYDSEPRTITKCIWDMNDVLCWTREQIADWIEAIENQAVATGAPPVVASADPLPLGAGSKR